MCKCFYKGVVKDKVNNKVIEIKSAVAIYDDKYENRYSLDIELSNKNKKELTVIMFNPSEKALKKYEGKRKKTTKENPLDITDEGKKKTFVDGTITNVIRIADKCNYSKITILNLFSKINSKKINIINCLKEPKKEDIENIRINDKEIEYYLNNKNDILIAWGKANKNKELDIKKIMDNWSEKIEKGRQKYFHKNNDGSPTHPSPLNQEKVNDFLEKYSELKEYDIIQQGN